MLEITDAVTNPQRYRIDWRSTNFSFGCMAHFYGTDEADAERQLRSLMGSQVQEITRVWLDPVARPPR